MDESSCSIRWLRLSDAGHACVSSEVTYSGGQPRVWKTNASGFNLVDRAGFGPATFRWLGENLQTGRSLARLSVVYQAELPAHFPLNGLSRTFNPYQRGDEIES